MAWNVDFTEEAEGWLTQLPRRDRVRVLKAVKLLGQVGPSLGRPHVDTVHGSRHANMKELRVRGTPVRALFAFGPDRRAIVLIGGSKHTGEKRWYRTQINVASRLLDNHLNTFTRESTCRAARAGSRSNARQR